MTFIIRKTQLSDIDYLGDVERSASAAFKSIPDLAWIAETDVISAEEHSQFVDAESSWVAIESKSHDLSGFILTEIIDRDMYIAEVSVSAVHQKKGLGTQLLKRAFTEATALGIEAAILTTFIDVPWNAPYYKRLGFAILSDDDMPAYLAQKLGEEEASGLHVQKRCAMRKAL